MKRNASRRGWRPRRVKPDPEDDVRPMDFVSIDPEVVTIFTDGSCYPNPGPAGWAFMGMYGSFTHRGSGHISHATNNEAELTAVKMALSSVQDKKAPVLIVTDSRYVLGALTKWPPIWEKCGWKNSVGEPVANGTLIREIISLKLLQIGGVTFQWTKGHRNGMTAYIEFNRQVDAAASRARKYGLSNALLPVPA